MPKSEQVALVTEDHAVLEEQQQCPIHPDFKREFSLALQSGEQVIIIETREPGRAVQDIGTIAAEHNLPLIEWDSWGGWSQPEQLNEMNAVKGNPNPDPLQACQLLRPNGPFAEQSGIFVFHQLQVYLEKDPRLRAGIQMMADRNQFCEGGMSRPLVLLCTSISIPEDLQFAEMIEYPLPTKEQLDYGVIEYIHRSTVATNNRSAEVRAEAIKQGTPADELPEIDRTNEELPDELRNELRKELLGFTLSQGEKALAKAVVECNGFTGTKDVLHARGYVEKTLTVPDLVRQSKAKVIKSVGGSGSEVLEYVDRRDVPSIDEIAGFDLLLEDCRRKTKAYSAKAEELLIDLPKGIVLGGVPGTGKTYVAKALASLMGMNLFIFHITALFRQYVGQTEALWREVRRIIEAQNGCILLWDEIEKVLADVEGSGGNNVAGRLKSEMLTWLSEKTCGTFVVMTLNRTTGVKMEMFRQGRIDRLYQTSLPHQAERIDAIRIHLKQRHVVMADLNLTEEQLTYLGQKTDKMVHSEIEAVVIEARAIAFDERESAQPTFEEFQRALTTIGKPQAVRDPAGIKEIEESCKDFLPVTSVKSSTTVPRPTQRTERQFIDNPAENN
jgi:ATP-dependent 26S proteasome regulatory subunit